ncbi:MAG: SGNH/GDSL hydrolase family protein, partial [Planctomycetota bacterium]
MSWSDSVTIGRRRSAIVSIAAGAALLIASCDRNRPALAIPRDTSFATFDSRARAGERLNVVFFGASLTWGANASDQNHTSYRARVADRLEEEYPDAHFKFFDAGLGGTGSQLGVFRLDRDVLRRKPDLVFLDFSANDDIGTAEAETLASYEALVRRIVSEAECPLVMMVFPFRWNVQEPDLQEMKGRTAHLAIADAYSLPVGDAISLCIDRVRSGATTVEKIWPHDGVHPGDFGYTLFAEAAWSALRKGIERDRVCKAPDTMLHADTYMTSARVRVSSLGALPAGWRVGGPTLTSAWFDARMSRWLDDEVIAANRGKVVGEDGKESEMPQAVVSLKARFRGTMLLLFGEKTLSSAR